mgnify:CR=1 FL=1
MWNPLFLLPPETAHKVALWSVKHRLVSKNRHYEHSEKELCGIKFSASVGLSAGADKEGYALNGWGKVGFGFVETGTVTLNPREGNPKPRIWRQKKSNSIVNWMGLPGEGLDAFLKNIKNYRAHPSQEKLVIGVSIASPEGKINDLKILAKEISPYADYFTLNASCPNVDHGAQGLDLLVEQIKAVNASSKGAPLFLKIAPTRDQHALEATLKTTFDVGVKGFVLTNTVPATASDLLGDFTFKWPEYNGDKVGGYSGPKLLDTTCFMVSCARKILGKSVPIIGVGGIQSAQDAQQVIKAGADLIQLYTGFVYSGPRLIDEINKSFL